MMEVVRTSEMLVNFYKTTWTTSQKTVIFDNSHGHISEPTNMICLERSVMGHTVALLLQAPVKGIINVKEAYNFAHKKFKVSKSAGKAMGILFWDCMVSFFGLLHEETPVIHHKMSVYFWRVSYYCHGTLKNLEESSMLFYQSLNQKRLRTSGFLK
jgi:hypothetical protein